MQNSQPSDGLLKDPLRSLSEISESINTLHELDAVLRRILDIALKTINGERGMVLLRGDQNDGELSIRVAHKIDSERDTFTASFSKSIVSTAMQAGETLISYNVPDDDRFGTAQSISQQKIIAAACLPLRIKAKPVGAIYIDSSASRGQFRPEMEPFLNAFAHQAAIAIENAQMYDRLRSENRRLREVLQKNHDFGNIIGRSPAMQRVTDLLRQVADTPATVMLLGESGTGKEVIAKSLHYNSSRKDKPFIACFCGSLPESLLESELFGHKAGAFTGARADKKGLFEEAEGGTFFLDEIADISERVQTQLLRVLQEREIRRVGDNQTRKIDVRIVAATNKDLREEVKAGRFREDLFYRLNVITINMPALRERGEDIILLAQHFVDAFASRFEKAITGFSADALETLRRYGWPGNVRELENTIERAVLLAKHEIIEVQDLQLETGNAAAPVLPPDWTMKAYERFVVEQAMQHFDSNISETAKSLGVSRRWLHYRIKEWGL